MHLAPYETYRSANTAALDVDGHSVILEGLELVLGELKVLEKSVGLASRSVGRATHKVLLSVLDGVSCLSEGICLQMRERVIPVA